VAYCTAPFFDLKKIDEIFHGNAPPRAVHRALPFVHVVNPKLTSDQTLPSAEAINVFFFSHGSFVAWGTTPAQDKVGRRLSVEFRLAILVYRLFCGSTIFSVELHCSEWFSFSCQLILAKLNEAFESHPRYPVVEMEEYSWMFGPTNDVDTKRDSLVLAQDDPHIQVAFSFGLAGSVKVVV
jgi:uncharacterized Rmd1/YagE family protein